MTILIIPQITFNVICDNTNNTLNDKYGFVMKPNVVS